MTEPSQGLLDTSVVIDLPMIDPSLLPDDTAIAAVTLAELAAGPHATTDETERARRQDRLQWASSTWNALPFDVDASRMYGRLFAAMRASGRTSRARLADLLIASTAAANGLPLYTRNPSDFAGLEGIVTVRSI
jgi:predicted nucleic acid-binding protein